jgi:hypothetical protein
MLEDDHSFVKTFISSVEQSTREAKSPTGRAFWCDAGLLNQAGKPSIVYGSKGEGLHAAEE